MIEVPLWALAAAALAFLALVLYVVRQGNVIAALEGKLAKQDRLIDALTEPGEHE
jgi:CelD/BcsL family acetyltransferase involved in cellulose biosynthesis